MNSNTFLSHSRTAIYDSSFVRFYGKRFSGLKGGSEVRAPSDRKKYKVLLMLGEGTKGRQERGKANKYLI